MAALDVFKEICKIADTDFLATDVLPALWSFSLGPLLNLQQFQSFMALIRSSSTRIEQEHTRKLQEMSTTSPSVASRNDLMSFGGVPGRSNGADNANGDTFDFESLVLGTKKASSPAPNAFSSWESKPVEPIAAQAQSQRSPTSTTPTFSWATVQEATKPSNSAGFNTGTLGGFGVLQPTSASSSTSAFSQPLQPSRPALQTPTANPVSADWSGSGSNTNAWSTVSNTSSNNAWPTTSSTTSSNPWGTTTPTIAPSTNLWASSANTPNYNLNNTLRPNNGTLGQSSFSIPPPPASTTQFSSFGIAPPPMSSTNSFGSMGSNLSGTQNSSASQANAKKKSGLDKYESLI
jgi:SCY1-like protein 2